MKTEKILCTPKRVIPQEIESKDMVTITVPKSTAKSAAMLAASMLALASMAKADIHQSYLRMNPKDLTYESTNENERTIFSDFIKARPEIKNYERLDKNTLRFIDELDTVIDKSLTDGVNDIEVQGYAVNGNLYPQKGKPLTEQKYYDDKEYDKIMERNKRDERTQKIATASGGIFTLAVLLYLFKKHDVRELFLSDTIEN